MALFGKFRNAALAGLALTALAASPALTQDKEIKVGMVNLSLCCAYFVGMDAAVKDEASHFANVKVLSTDAKGDVAKLTSDVEDLLNQNVNVFVISGAWIEAAPAALERSTRPVCRSSWSIGCSRAATSPPGSAPTTAPSARESATTSSSA